MKIKMAEIPSDRSIKIGRTFDLEIEEKIKLVVIENNYFGSRAQKVSK